MHVNSHPAQETYTPGCAQEDVTITLTRTDGCAENITLRRLRDSDTTADFAGWAVVVRILRRAMDKDSDAMWALTERMQDVFGSQQDVTGMFVSATAGRVGAESVSMDVSSLRVEASSVPGVRTCSARAGETIERA
eukprot:3788786-Rhodomonas_salina.1